MTIQPSIDRVIDDYGGRVADRLNRLANVHILNGTLLENVTPLADGVLTKIAHGLGRTPRGWFVVNTKYDGPEFWISDSITPTTNSSGTKTHDLGGRPTEVRAKIICTSTNLNYSVGDIVYLDISITRASDRGSFLIAQTSATDLFYHVGNAELSLPDASTGQSAALGSGSWDLYLEAWRPRLLHEGLNRQSNPERNRFLYLYGAGFTGTDKVDLWVF